VNKANVSARLKEIKGDKEFADEYAVLQGYLALVDKETDIKQSIKEAEKQIEAKVFSKYPKMTLDEIRSLVVDCKWLAALEARIMGEVDRLSQTLSGRVKELALRYENPLPAIAGEVDKQTAMVEGHLNKMGFNL
jgi:type I restriction enzyme M protein